MGRFYGNDPMGFRSADVFSFNRYAYGKNNPYKWVDPDGRDSCPSGESTKVCIRSDTFDSSRSNGQTTQASPEVAKAMVDGKNVVAVKEGGTKEKIGFVVPNQDGKPEVVAAADASTGSGPGFDSASAVKPDNALAVIHGHIDGVTNGVVSNGDAGPLRSGLPNGVVSEGRVGVTEIVGGQLQFRMLSGKMERGEVTALQKQLNNQQEQFHVKKE